MAFCEYFTDNAKSILSVICNIADTTVTITDISIFPTLTPFRLRTEDEIMLVTSVLGNVCTVTRAQEGTTAVAHPAGAMIANVFTLESLNNATWCYCQEGNFTARPASDPDFTGRIWFNDTGFYLNRDDGSIDGWTTWGPLFDITEANDTGFSWINQGSATVSTTDGGLAFSSPGVGVNPVNLMMYIKSTPATPYTFTAGFIPTIYPSNQTSIGLVLRESATSKVVFLRLVFDTTLVTNADMAISVDKYSNPTTPAGNYNVFSASILKGPLVWFQITNDGTDLYFKYSNNNVDFTTAFTTTVTNYFTTGPDQIGYCLSSNTAAGYAAMAVLSFE